MYNQQSNTTSIVQPVQTVAPVYTTAPPATILRVNTIRNLGISQIVFGFITLIAGVVVIVGSPNYWFSVSGTGIWTGIFMIITGGVCVGVYSHPDNNGIRCAALVLSINCICIACAAGVMAYVSFIGLLTCYSYNYDYYTYYDTCSYATTTAKFACACMMIIMTVEFVLALITAVYTGRGCCGPSYSAGTIIQQQPAFVTTGTTSYMATQQGAYPPQYGGYPSAGQPYSTAGYQPYQQQPAPVTTQAAMAQGNVTYGYGNNEKVNLVGNSDNIGTAPPPYNSQY